MVIIYKLYVYTFIYNFLILSIIYPSGRLALITNSEIYFKNYFECLKNKTSGCLMTFSTKERQEKHSNICHTPDTIKENPQVIQVELGNSVNYFDKLCKIYHLTDNEQNNTNFLFYDIESILKPIFEQRGKCQVKSKHNIVSIAAISRINGTFNEQFWVVDDSTDASISKIVSSFIVFCIEQSEKMYICPKLYKIEEELKAKLAVIKPNFFTPDTEQTKEIRGLLFALKNLMQLNIYAYNNSGYDMKLLMEYLASDKFFKMSDFHILKRNKNYLSVRVNNLVFKDLLLFSSPLPLDKYLKTWSPQKNVKKLLFPYELFTSIEGKPKEF